MSVKTDIQWADSTVNGQMGCDGCELWTPKVRACYAGTLTGRYAGQKGWPKAFDKPDIFPGRIQQACSWTDLAGQERPDKPWLGRLPRMIFLDDMGDTFTESLDRDWLLPDIPRMASSPHLWLFLTKRARRMGAFFERLGYVPESFWLGTSVTGPETMARARELAKVQGAFTWLSLEPLLEPVDISSLLRGPGKPRWLVIGGESGPSARPFSLDWARTLLALGQQAGVPVFIKQLGAVWAAQAGGDDKGGDWSLWPADLRVREVPTWGFSPRPPASEMAFQQLELV